MQGDSRKMVGIEASGRFTFCAQQEAPPYKYVTNRPLPWGVDNSSPF